MMALQQQSLESMSAGKETMLSRTSSHLGNQSRVQESGIIGQEEMAGLRQQLQSEAENIARWKASTEVKIKNMERDIQEKQSIIDDQRNNLMELQLHSEHLSQSLFQERQERELVSAKVDHTRQFFLALQEQHERLSETVSSFQSTKDDMQKEHDWFLEKLTTLKEGFVQQENSIEIMTSKAEENVNSLATAKELWQRSVMEKDQELKELNVQLEKLQSDIGNLSGNLERTTSNLSAVENDKAHLCSELDEVKASQEELKLQKERLTEQITRADEELKLKHEQLMERTKEFQEAVEKIQYLKKANDTLEGAKSELTERVTALATRKQELEEEISYKDNIIQTLQSTQNKSLMETNELNDRLSDVCSQLSILEGQKVALEQERDALSKKLLSSKKKLLKKKTLLDQFKEQVTALQSNLEAQKEALNHLEEENKNKDVSLNEINEKNIVCNETIKEMTQKIDLSKTHEAELTEEKKKMEEDLEKASSDLKAKVEECEDLSATIKGLKDDMKKLEKECEVKIKNVSSETKSKRILEQKINACEEKLKKAMKNSESLQDELKKTKNMLTEKEKECEGLKESVDRALCEKQEFQYKYEAKDQSFQEYQSYTNTSLDTLKTELDQTKEMLEKTKTEHEQQVLQLHEELDKTKEDLNSSKAAHEIELQETTKAFHEQQNTSVAQQEEELASLKAKMEAMIIKLEQANQKASTAIKDKLQMKLESDNKVKEMGDLWDIYKTDKEAKLKTAEEELQKSRSQISQLTQEKDELLAKIEAQTRLAKETVKAGVTQDANSVIKGSTTAAAITDDIKTPSPDTYLQSLKVFAEPHIPTTPRGSSIKRKPEPPCGQEKQVQGILKTGRRTLLPPEYQKHRVVFKPLTPIKDYTSGDSSSDTGAFEVADSDDPFEEIKRSRKAPSIRSEKLPRANVAPFIPETNISMKPPLPLNEKKLDNEANKEPAVNTRRKRIRGELHRQNLKTYSPVSPRNKQQKPQ